MTNDEKKRIADMVAKDICECYFYLDCKYNHILKALDIIDKTGTYEHFFEPILNYREEITIDSDKLFAANIDDSINYLLELKKDGWVGIDEAWSGYEDNYFVACKYIKEPDVVYKDRIEKLIKGYIPGILEEEKKIKKKEKMIEKLKKELNELKNKK